MTCVAKACSHISCFIIISYILFSFVVGCRFVGRLFVKALGKPTEILLKLNEMAGFSPNEEIELYEVSFSFEVLILFLANLYMCLSITTIFLGL